MVSNSAKELSGKKILFASIAADGHFNPLTGLAKHLIAQGCEVCWYTSGIYREKLNKLGIRIFPFIRAKDINSTTLNEIFPERLSFTEAGDKANFDLINVFIKQGPDNFLDILDLRKSFDFDIMIADNMFSAIPYVSAKLEVPVVSIGIIPLAEASAELGPYGPGFYPAENDEERTKIAELKTFFKEHVYRESTNILSALLDEYGIAHQKTDFFDIYTKAPDLYLQIGSPSFEYKRDDMGKNVKFIGALLPYSAQSPSDTPWFDERLKVYKKVVLVTQGTVERDVSKLIEPTLDAFKDSDVLVIVTTGGSDTERLRALYPFKNFIIEDYLPFDQVMHFADVFITNGGYGGTLLSIQHQLPMVAAGVYEGKAEICARLGFFGYGIDLKTERPSSAQIFSAAEAVMSNPQFKSNIEKLSAELNAYNAYQICTDYIGELIGESRAIV